MVAISPVEVQVRLGDYRQGLAVYQALPAPQSEDDRWYCACLVALGRDFEARSRYARAAADHHPWAVIGLAHLYALTGQQTLADQLIRDLDLPSLSRLDRVLTLRHQAAAQHRAGELRTAVDLLERAWIEGHGLADAAPELASAALHLATVYMACGTEQQAATYLAYALEHGTAVRRPYTLGAYALSLAYQGRHSEAQDTMREVMGSIEALPRARSVLFYEDAVVARARGDLDYAGAAFLQAEQSAMALPEFETACFAALGACIVATAQGRLTEARSHLQRADRLATNTLTVLHVQFRRLALQVAQGVCVGTALQQVAQNFQARHLNREAGWAWLHAAEAACLGGDPDAATFALERAADVRHAVGHGQALVMELRTLPRALRHLAEDHSAYAAVLAEDLQRRPVAVLRLNTLGTAALVLNRVPVRLALTRSLEVLAYLIAHPHCTLRQIQLALFPDRPHRRARSYFHQVRDDLKKSVPGLSIPHDRRQRTYSVQLEQIDFSWDHRDLGAALARVETQDTDLLEVLSGSTGVFLPHAEGPWASQEREQLQAWVLRLGMKTLTDWQASQDSGRCLRLARRLVELEPDDEALNVVLLRAVQEVEGDLAARAAYRAICRRFEENYGEVPPGLAQLGETLQRLG
jgi:tetratricopeptide (TPR) repeat protein